MCEGQHHQIASSRSRYDQLADEDRGQNDGRPDVRLDEDKDNRNEAEERRPDHVAERYLSLDLREVCGQHDDQRQPPTLAKTG